MNDYQTKGFSLGVVLYHLDTLMLGYDAYFGTHVYPWGTPTRMGWIEHRPAYALTRAQEAHRDYSRWLSSDLYDAAHVVTLSDADRAAVSEAREASARWADDLARCQSIPATKAEMSVPEHDAFRAGLLLGQIVGEHPAPANTH